MEATYVYVTLFKHGKTIRAYKKTIMLYNCISKKIKRNIMYKYIIIIQMPAFHECRFPIQYRNNQNGAEQ